MLWFILHNIIHLFPFGENQTKNLFTFLIGVVCYTFIYTLLGSITSKDDNLFMFTLFNYFTYILLADAFAMAIIYKNYYKTTIIGEATDVFTTNKTNKLTKEIEEFALNQKDNSN